MKLIIPVLLTIIFYGCESSIKEKHSTLSEYDFEAESKIIYLPESLKEVSGLACVDSDYILAHNDEQGIVSKLEISTGKIISEYAIGMKELKKDIEGIAVVRDSVYMAASNGALYKFSVNNQADEIKYDKFETILTSKNNVEGLCYDEKTNSLFLACKDDPGKGYKKYKAVYEFKLDEMKFTEAPRFLISLKQLQDEYDIKDFSPSGIEIDPVNNNYFIISANPEAVIEMNSEGKLIDAVKLNNKKHKQPEGIAFLRDGTMILADESNGRKARLTFIQLIK